MLTVVEGRVLGCLMEKERTTPDQYPLSLNALVMACNQSTAREPVMLVDPLDAEAAITSMKGQGLARLVHPSHGRSVTRYRQVADEHFDWTTQQAAVMTVLLLRGPQTLAEIRTRTERMHEFESLGAVEDTLRSLSASEPPMVVELERQPGQKELRWQQQLAEEAEAAPRLHAIAPAGGVGDRVADLDARIAELSEHVTALSDRVAHLEAALADLL